MQASLDPLMRDKGAQVLTGDFDLVLQLAGDTIDQLLREMHSERIVPHGFAAYLQDQLVELTIGAPDLKLSAVPSADGKVRGVASASVLYHSRNLEDPSDVGTDAAA